MFEALNAGKNVLQQINKEMSLEAVEKFMEESDEAISYQHEVSSLLSKELSPVDEETIMKELNNLELKLVY